jgi:DNA-binding HxlR family transcriptional regulator
MNSQENEEEDLLIDSDMRIIDILRRFPSGLHFKELKEKLGITQKTLSKRLKKLWGLGWVERTIEKSKHPIGVVYKLTRNRPTLKDIHLIHEALASYSYMEKIQSVTSWVQAQRYLAKARDEERKFFKIEYSELYPYFLWCLHYASEAESDYVRRQIIKWYLFRLRNDINDTVSPREEQHRNFFKRLIDLASLDFDKELEDQFTDAKETLVSFFPQDLQDFANSYMDFWYSSFDETDILEGLRDMAKNREWRKAFERHYGKKVSRFTIEKSLEVLTKLHLPRSPKILSESRGS